MIGLSAGTAFLRVEATAGANAHTTYGEEQDFDVKSFVVREKYVLVRQPIPKRPPDGLNLPRLVWIICKRWNDEFLERQRTAKRIIEKIELCRACTHTQTKVEA